MLKTIDRVKSRSELKVMESNAGFYIGQTCVIEIISITSGKVVDSYTEPYDRNSGYFATEKDAENYMNGF